VISGISFYFTSSAAASGSSADQGRWNLIEGAERRETATRIALTQMTRCNA
jgi:hypothetical protein